MFQGRAEIVANLVGDRLEKDPLVAEGMEINLERFQLHAGLSRNVAHRDGAEVRMTRHRADRRKLVMSMLDQKIALWRGIGKGFQ